MNTSTTSQVSNSTQEAAWLDVPQIDTPEYARKHSPEGIESLAADMARNQQLQNIVVIVKEDGRFECVSGNGRLEAAKKLGWLQIRADVKQGLSEVQKLGIVVSENQEREGVCPFYTAMLYNRMLQASGRTQEDFAQQLGKSAMYISRYMTLAQVPVQVWQDHQDRLSSVRQCLEIARLSDVEQQKHLAEACAKEGLSGAAAKKRAKTLQGEDAESGITSSAEEGPKVSFGFTWKGSALIIKGRPYQPYAQPFGEYLGELESAYHQFMEAEKAKGTQQAA